MRTLASAAALLAALLLAGARAAAWHEGAVDGAARLAQSAQEAADALGAAALRAAEQAAGTTGGMGGPLGQAAGVLVGAAVGAAGDLWGSAGAAYLAAGEADGSFNLSKPGGGRTTTRCLGMQVHVEHHPPLSTEASLTVSFAAGQGSPLALCTVGWRSVFTPDEVEGSEEQGWRARSESIDAIIDLVLGPEGQDGRRALWLRQVTYPQGIADTLEVQGFVRDVL